MKPAFFLIVLFTLTMPLLPRVNGAEAAPRLLLKWKDGPTSPAAAVGNAAIGSTVVRTFHAIGWQAVELPPNLSLRAGMAAYLQLGTVAAVEPDVQLNVPGSSPLESEPTDHAAGVGLAAAALSPPDSSGRIPNDPLFAQQWNLKIIGATNAWAVTTGSAEVVVAVFDTGIDYTHPDLAPNMWRNPGETGLDAEGHDKATNGIDDDANGYVDDVHGVDVVRGTGDPMDVGCCAPPNATPAYHGTLVAGFIGAVGNNGQGMCGVNWSVRIMSIRPWPSTPPGPNVWVSHTLAAWDYVIMMKRRGINIRVASKSIGGTTKSAAMLDAILIGGEEGILTVFAALNEALDQDVYSYFPNAFRLWCVLNVASSTELDNLAPSSCFGRSTVDIAAPGANVMSTSKGGTYQSGIGGTSFACPTVSGAAALLLAANPTLTVNEIKAALFGSVDQPIGLRNKLVTHGRLNIARALEYLTNSNPPAVVIHMAPAGQQGESSSPIRVRFNRPMNRGSVEAAFSLSPPVDGTFVWTDDNRSFAFAHDLPFDLRTNYTVRISGAALDEAGRSLDGNFNRIREGAPSDDFVWFFHFPIANDDFADAKVITGLSGEVQDSNRYTFIEAGEPGSVWGNEPLEFGSSVWYRWAAPESGGWFTFDLGHGTAFDSLLAVFTGESLSQLITVAANDDDGSRHSSRLSFPSIPGTQYSVVVASKSDDPNQAGPFALAWYPTPPPAVSSFSPATGYPGQKVTINGTNFTGTTRVLFSGAPATFAFSTNAALRDLQLTASVPLDATSGPVTVETPHGNFMTSSNFTVLVRPLMAIRSVPGTNLVELSWPSTSGFSLQRADNPAPGATWTSTSIVSTSLTNGIRSVTVSLVSSNRFFRLYKP